jgi:EAL domain-containing protein (putative c-di-GMP-specific phosphodiesterase class I)
VIEVTEHVPVEDYDALNAHLEGLRARGTRLAIDDAGAGFASLRHILLLHPDVIKLDVSLTRGVEDDIARRALASAFISFAAEIGATIVAEGIETRTQFETLRRLGVRYGQGWYLARPAPAATIGKSGRRSLLAA